MNRLLKRVLSIGVMSAALVPFVANAATSRPNVTLNMTAVQVVSVDGKETVKPITGTLQHGAIVRYEIVAQNVGGADAVALKPSAKIPFGMTYVEKSATGDGQVAFSLDGKTFAANPVMKSMKDGKPVTLPAPISTYRAVQWTLNAPLHPNTKIAFDYEVRVR